MLVCKQTPKKNFQQVNRASENAATQREMSACEEVFSCDLSLATSFELYPDLARQDGAVLVAGICLFWLEH